MLSISGSHPGPCQKAASFFTSGSPGLQAGPSPCGWREEKAGPCMVWKLCGEGTLQGRSGSQAPSVGWSTERPAVSHLHQRNEGPL
jgi:hypothetical protein